MAYGTSYRKLLCVLLCFACGVVLRQLGSPWPSQRVTPEGALLGNPSSSIQFLKVLQRERERGNPSSSIQLSESAAEEGVHEHEKKAFQHKGEQDHKAKVWNTGAWDGDFTVRKDIRFWIQSESSHCMAHKLAQMMKTSNVARAAEFGCGAGDWTKSLKASGINVDGYDGNPHVENQTGGLCKYADFTAAWQHRSDYDAVFSFEVAEHIPMELESKFLDNLLRSSPTLVFLSWSPGMGGHGHVNPQPKSYVIKRLQLRGYVYDDRMTRDLASSSPKSKFWKDCVKSGKYEKKCGCCCSWVAKNVLVFHKAAPSQKG